MVDIWTDMDVISVTNRAKKPGYITLVNTEYTIVDIQRSTSLQLAVFAISLEEMKPLNNISPPS